MKKLIRTLGISAAAALLTWGCSSDNLFGEYSGKSFLTTSSLRDDSWQLMPDYSFETGTATTDYMDFSKTSDTGGPNGGPVYRLEIKNLLQNGDFEDATVTNPEYGPWFVYHEAGTPPAIIPEASLPLAPPNNTDVNRNNTTYLHGNYNVNFYTATSYRLAVLLKTSFVNSATYIKNKDYVFHLAYRTAANIRLHFEPGWLVSAGETLGPYDYEGYGGPNGSNENTNVTNLNSFPALDPDVASPKGYNVFTAQNDTVSPAAEDTLAFASSGSQTAHFDDFRIVRDSEGDFDLRLRLKLNLNHRSDLNLIPGYYRFSVYVKAENSAVNNVFDADRVELGIEGYDTTNNLTVQDRQVYYKTSALHNLYSQSGSSFQGDWSSSWVKLVLASDQTIQLPDISATPVMELSISPSNPGTTDASWNRLGPGSILVSEPILEYSNTPWN